MRRSFLLLLLTVTPVRSFVLSQRQSLGSAVRVFQDLPEEAFDYELLTKEEELELAGYVQAAQELEAKLKELRELQKLERASATDTDDLSEELQELTDFHNHGYSVYSAAPELNSGTKYENGSAYQDLRLTATDRETLCIADADELQSILDKGTEARRALISRNIKLVVSICNNWFKRATRKDVLPSRDDAIQEGIIGLTTAAERFQPSRNLRFSTYATFWITNSIRRCFYLASTSGVRYPERYYEVRGKFRKMAAIDYQNGDKPSLSNIAEEMDAVYPYMKLNEPRLRHILAVTKPSFSLDAPLNRPSGTAGQAGSVGVDSITLGETLVDKSESPEDMVELSLLRQSLENAMASELSPHERDVVRLRLGLDDGVTRTCREVSEYLGKRLSHSEVRTAENRALRKLRSPVALSSFKFLAYLDFCDVDRDTMKFFR